MAGNRIGGLKAAETNRRLHGEDHYSKAGKLGGSKKVPKGFARMERKKHIEASFKGGQISRRTKRIFT